MRKLWQSTALISGLLCLVAFGVTTGLRDLGAFQWIDLLAYDLFIRFRPLRGSDDAKVVIVGATETDLNEWGWPLSDETLARALRNLLKHGPRVIGVDLYRDQPIEPGGERLNDVLRSNDRIIWVTKFGDRRSAGVPPPAVLINTDRYGFADIIQDRDGVTRRGLLFLDDGRTTSSGFALRLALGFLAAGDVHAEAGENGHLRVGGVTIPPLQPDFGGYARIDARGYQVLLDYASGPSPFEMIDFGSVANDNFRGEAVRDRIVIIGVTANSVKDYFLTPFSRGENIDQTVFGVTLQAQIAQQLLRHATAGVRPFQALSGDFVWGWIFLWAMLAGLLSYYVTESARFGIAAVGLFAAYGTLVYAAFLQSWWLPVIPGLVCILLSVALVRIYRFRLERAQRRLLMSLFSSYVSNQVAEEIWHRREEIMQGGRPRPQRQVATALFSDIRDFTAISERLEPHALMNWLNDYMDVMVRLVVEHGGVIEKFAGDGITALFGVPAARTTEAEIRDDALRALRCAVAMKAALQNLNNQLDASGEPRIGIRIGIHTGPMIVGSIGSAERMQYTAIGDSVNIAARLESLGKEVETIDRECRILLSDATARYTSSEFEHRCLGPFHLKGKKQAVSVFELIGSKCVGEQPGS